MKLIIFDYDGVLVDSFECNRRIYLEISKEFNLNLPEHPEYYKELWELDWMQTMRKLNIVSPKDLARQETIYRQGLTKYAYLIKPYEGVPKVLDSLSRKYKLAVVSNNFKSELKERLSRFGLLGYFDSIYSFEDGKLKPDPDLLIKAMSSLSVSPEETAFVGDMDGDIKSGRSAGVGKLIAVSYGFHMMHRLKGADVVVNSPTELLEYL